MFEKLSDIKISGGGFPTNRFPDGVKLPILQYRMNLIYGRNGCGKSTIASAFQCWKDGGPDEDVKFELLNTPPDLDKKSVYVFNENFINKNILERSNGPETIVMIGTTSVDIQHQIEEVGENVAKLESQLAEVNGKISILEDERNPKSKAAAFKGAEKQLTLDGGYAERTVLIQNHIKSLQGKHKKSISEDLIENLHQIGECHQDGLPSTKDELIKLVGEEITMLCAVSGDSTAVEWNKPCIKAPFDVAQVNRLLGETVESPVLNERESKIFEMLEDVERMNYLKLTQKDILEANANYCPLCHQQVDSNVRSSLTESIQRLLGEKVSRFDDEIRDVSDAIGEIVVPFPSFPNDLYSNHIRNCQSCLYEINRIIADTKAALLRKRDNKFNKEEYRVDGETLGEALQNMKNALESVVQDVSEYNELIENNQKLEKKAMHANSYLGYLEAKDYIKQYVERNNKLKQATDERETLNADIKGRKDKLNNLGLELRQTSIALDYVNAQLRNIFFTTDRLWLKGENEGSYVIYSRGKAIKPGKLSTGERNIIALAYFFATLQSGKTRQNKYADPMFVVIDDPVTSFDFDNRAGITSFLSVELNNVLKSNADSKVLLFSHDLHTIMNLTKTAKVFNGKNIVNGKDTIPLFFELTEGELRRFYRNDNEYWKMLQDIYEYAVNTTASDSDELGIGNKMRRTLETYSTFMFQCGYKDMLEKDYICDSIPSKQKDYYKHFLGKFMLDALSHAGNRSDTLNFTESFYSHSEKQSMAQSLLKFLYYTNTNHLKAYLNNNQFDEVKKWAEYEQK